MKIKIISNGLMRQNVRIVNAETDELIEGVQTAELVFSVDHPGKLILTFIDVVVEADINCIFPEQNQEKK